MDTTELPSEAISKKQELQPHTYILCDIDIAKVLLECKMSLVHTRVLLVSLLNPLA